MQLGLKARVFDRPLNLEAPGIRAGREARRKLELWLERPGPRAGGVLSPASMAVRRYGKRPCADFPRFRLRKR